MTPARGKGEKKNAKKATKTERDQSVARAKSSTLKAGDAILEEVAGLIPFGKLTYKLGRTLIQHASRVHEDNREQALQKFADVVEGDEERFRRLEERVQAGDIATEELSGRLTLCFGAIREAETNPHRKLREAQGRFAARVLVTDVDEIERFEVAEMLNRMTALDYTYLKIVSETGDVGMTPTQVYQRLVTEFPKVTEGRFSEVRRRAYANRLAQKKWVGGGTGARADDPTPEFGVEQLDVATHFGVLVMSLSGDADFARPEQNTDSATEPAPP